MQEWHALSQAAVGDGLRVVRSGETISKTKVVFRNCAVSSETSLQKRFCCIQKLLLWYSETIFIVGFRNIQKLLCSLYSAKCVAVGWGGWGRWVVA